MVERWEGQLPDLFRLMAAPVGLLPLGPALTLAVRGLAWRRPAVFERLGSYRHFSFLIEPSDLDFAFVVVPDGIAATVRMVGKRPAPASDVRVRGPLLVLLGVLDGTFDGDALFFSRAISVSGKMDALLALRNAIEDAELKPSDLLGLGGKAATLLDGFAFHALEAARRLAGAPTAGASR